MTSHFHPPLFSFWHGAPSWLERCGLTSMVAKGHEVTIFSYWPEELLRERLPAGVTVLDARTVLPLNDELARVLRTHPALVSGVFCYFGLVQRCGVWIDLDMLLLRPIPWPTGTFMASFESPRTHKLGVACLWIDHRAELLDVLLGFVEQRPILPPWFNKRRTVGHRFWAAVGQPYLPTEAEWSVWGPSALTFFINEFGLTSEVLPRATFYPVPREHAEELLSPAARPWKRFDENTVGIHLWGNRLRKLMRTRCPPFRSFLHIAHERDRNRLATTPTVEVDHGVH